MTSWCGIDLYPEADVIIILMGVTGTGKTTVGQRLAAELRWPFYDADDLHPPENVAKMRHGEPLTDADRTPWLNAVAALLGRLDAEGRSAVVACSALREAYRRRLVAGAQDVRFVHLVGPADLIGRRLRKRADHFMDPALLPDQLAVLEPSDEAVRVDVTPSPDVVVTEVRRRLRV